jgi:hypothetical protein
VYWSHILGTTIARQFKPVWTSSCEKTCGSKKDQISRGLSPDQHILLIAAGVAADSRRLSVNSVWGTISRCRPPAPLNAALRQRNTGNWMIKDGEAVASGVDDGGPQSQVGRDLPMIVSSSGEARASTTGLVADHPCTTMPATHTWRSS